MLVHIHTPGSRQANRGKMPCSTAQHTGCQVVWIQDPLAPMISLLTYFCKPTLPLTFAARLFLPSAVNLRNSLPTYRYSSEMTFSWYMSWSMRRINIRYTRVSRLSVFSITPSAGSKYEDLFENSKFLSTTITIDFCLILVFNYCSFLFVVMQVWIHFLHRDLVSFVNQFSYLLRRSCF